MSVVKEEGCYGGDMRPEDRIGGKPLYDPPLPVSVVKEPVRKVKEQNSNKGGLYSKIARLEDVKYDPPLPVSVVKEPEHKWVKGETDTYGGAPTRR